MGKTGLGLINVILFGLCATVWLIKFIYIIVNKPYPSTSILSILDGLCAIVWTVAFIVSVKRYRSKKGK